MAWRPGRRGVLAMAAAVALAGCGAMTPGGESEALAKQAYQHLVRKEDTALHALLTPAARAATNPAGYQMLRDMIPDETAPQATQTSWKAYAGTNGQEMTYEHSYAYSQRTVTATTVVVRPPGSEGWKIQSLKINVTLPAQPAAPAPAPAPGAKAT